MASSVYFSRSNGFAEKPHLGNGLPTYSSAVREKQHRHGHSVSWINPVSLPIPGVRTRRLRLMIPNFSRFYQSSQTRFGRRRGPFMLFLGLFACLYLIFAVNRRFGGDDKGWTPSLSFPDPSTLVYRREDIQRIWEWEIAAGHYPSGRRSTRNSAFLHSFG
jgi:DDB1- and CUL4-associated factor 13